MEKPKPKSFICLFYFINESESLCPPATKGARYHVTWRDLMWTRPLAPGPRFNWFKWMNLVKLCLHWIFIVMIAFVRFIEWFPWQRPMGHCPLTERLLWRTCSDLPLFIQESSIVHFPIFFLVPSLSLSLCLWCHYLCLPSAKAVFVVKLSISLKCASVLTFSLIWPSSRVFHQSECQFSPGGPNCQQNGQRQGGPDRLVADRQLFAVVRPPGHKKLEVPHRIFIQKKFKSSQIDKEIRFERFTSISEQIRRKYSPTAYLKVPPFSSL